jgi:hypothetical protein
MGGEQGLGRISGAGPADPVGRVAPALRVSTARGDPGEDLVSEWRAEPG